MIRLTKHQLVNILAPYWEANMIEDVLKAIEHLDQGVITKGVLGLEFSKGKYKIVRQTNYGLFTAASDGKWYK